MANRPKENSPPGPDPVDDQDEEEENPHVSPRESTPPRSPTPPESPKQVLIPTPPPSPKTTKVPTPPPSPKQKALLSAPTDIPPILTETTSLPTSSLITSTIPLSTPLITESITTTIPNINVEVNVSDTGATSVTDTPVINIPPSPTPSSASGATLGGDDEDYDSLYYSPYRIPTENDADAPVTSQHIQDIHDKLDRLLADSKAYGSVVLKAFLETAIKQYTDAIDRSTEAVDKSASSCAKATKEVSEVVHTTQIFLDSLKSHADTNQAKFQSSVDSFSKTLQDETTKFEALRTELKTESTSFLQSMDSRFVSLAVESTLKEDLIKHQATIDIQKVQLAQAEKEISLLKTQRAVYQSCAGDVKAMLTTLLAAHDPFLTLTIQKHLQSKLLPAIAILSEMMGVSEKVVLPKQGGEESAHLKSKTESKVNLASVSGKQVQIESDSDTEETIAEALQRKKRDRELNETMKVDREAEEKARRNKEEEDALKCKKTLFPEWDRDTLINQAIEFPSVYWLEPVASFDYDNSRDLQFDMPITRKAFTFHFFDVTAKFPHPNLKVDRELIDFYLKNGQPQYLT
ncbi:flocculation protein FLO11-like [Lactuca sativa]|uniref:flocculation protein FLO11-like n=1 Tax=Lactuca sativa TaxID=4236 RepID=UPI000CD8B481|nr:flocculation protein FLO11-like [Lactuca sativa]